MSLKIFKKRTLLFSKFCPSLESGDALKNFVKNHIEGIICFVIIVVADIILNILVYVPNSKITISPFENVLAGLLALIFSLLLEIISQLKSAEKGNHALNDSLCEVEQLIKILPDSRIKNYKYIDDVVTDLKKRLNTEGSHSVDFVLLDTRRRTTETARAKVMSSFIKDCCKNKDIKTRMLFNPLTSSLPSRYIAIINSLKKETNGYFAYQESNFSFASFFIIDKNTVFIRNPYKNGTETAYCIIKNDSLCKVYTNWFDIMWSEATIIDKNSFDVFDTRYRRIVPEDRVKEIEDIVNKYYKK